MSFDHKQPIADNTGAAMMLYRGSLETGRPGYALLFHEATVLLTEPDNFGAAFERLVRRANVPRIRLG